TKSHSLSMTTAEGIQVGHDWFKAQGWQPFPFQVASWKAYLQGKSGLVNAPTGSGKTYSLILPILLEYLRDAKGNTGAVNNGLRAIWITPIRALTREIQQAAQRAADELGLHWCIGIRSGDTSSSERQKQKKNPPEILITTPESLHLLLATKGYHKYFGQVRSIVIDEWHELIGSKRGVQIELAISRLRGLLPSLKVWGISATIGNMQEAREVLFGPDFVDASVLIRSKVKKKIKIETILPDTVESFPWSGHLGITLLEKVIPIIEGSTSTLIFTNTRAQCEIWYQRLLDVMPDWAGLLAMHHGSISRELRDWVENALHEGTLKAVVCTSSLDLGVDFRPVETIVQIGSPKGVARFLQRAGRSGHQPGAESVIHFVPTHSLQIVEGSALRQAAKDQDLESRLPYIRSFDVLVQYLVTLAVSDGFRPEDILPEIRRTYAFGSITAEEWAWCLAFITTGGESLGAYDEYKKVEVINGNYLVTSRRIALRHRLSIGAIVSDSNLRVKFEKGGYIGTMEEWFASQLNKGDNFWFAGRNLKFIRIKEMTVHVRLSRAKKGKVPSWMGSRMQLSNELSTHLRDHLHRLATGEKLNRELRALAPLVAVQQGRSCIPTREELLVEYFKDREGYHLLCYPFEGYYVHEGLANIVAWRITQQQPISFSIAVNDYGFELLSDQEMTFDEVELRAWLSTDQLSSDIESSINSTEMAKRRFRAIASISGLVFRGYPGKPKKDKHLQSSSQLFFEVFTDYEPENLLLLQAYEEIMTFQLEEARLRAALDRMRGQHIRLQRPAKATPFSFPILVDRWRVKMSSEKLEDRIAKMKLKLVE
ncbi:MAG: ligase-associated DNA damage response DEXH box helicase, partial [Bacteroidota bacterium]